MNPFIIAAVALSTVGVGSAIGFAAYKASKKNSKKEYDCIVHIDRTNLDNWKYHPPQEPNFFEKKFLVVAMVGFFKTGKTFHLNHIFDLDLPVVYDSELCVTNGISIAGTPANIAGGDVLLLDCAGKDSLFKGTDNADLVNLAKKVDDFTFEVAMSLSDAVIVCVNQVGMKTLKFLKNIQKSIESLEIPGFDKLIVFHNYREIESPEEAISTFKKFIEGQLAAKKVEQTVRVGQGYVTREYWISESEDLRFPTLHFLLAKHGSRAGKKFNNIAYDFVRDMIAGMRSRARVRHFKRELVDAMNKNKDRIEALANRRIVIDEGFRADIRFEDAN
jgi:hypothetical protein